jgi:glucose/arabinose dehydrogenase
VSFAEPREGGNGTSVAAAALVLDNAGGATLEDVEVIFRQEPTYDGDKHFGSRIVPTDDGNLYVTVGERSDDPIRDEAQDLQSGLGKIFRINAEGEAAEGNPFAEGEAQPEIWSLGHRNVQSATLDGEGRLWTVEHGARAGTNSTGRRPASIMAGRKWRMALPMMARRSRAALRRARKPNSQSITGIQ